MRGLLVFVSVASVVLGYVVATCRSQVAEFRASWEFRSGMFWSMDPGRVTYEATWLRCFKPFFGYGTGARVHAVYFRNAYELEDLSLLERFPYVRHISIQDADVSVDDVEKIALSPTIRSLSLHSDSEVSEETIRNLSRLDQLESVYVSESYRDRSGREGELSCHASGILDRLLELPRLRTLQLKFPIDRLPDGLRHAARLEKLELPRYFELSDEEFAALGELPSLRWLSCTVRSQPRLPVAAVRNGVASPPDGETPRPRNVARGRFNRLEMIHIRGQTDDAMLKLLGEAKRLQRIYAVGTGISADGVLALTRCPDLRVVSIDSYDALPGRIVHELARLHKLERLFLHIESLNSQERETLAALPSLRRLHLLMPPKERTAGLEECFAARGIEMRWHGHQYGDTFREPDICFETQRWRSNPRKYFSVGR